MAASESAIESELYRSAIELARHRYPVGWGGAAAMRLEGKDGESEIVTSVAIETANGSAALCIEVGAMCEAAKRNWRVTHTLCVAREDENSPFTVLSPCGICQERLRYWGDDVWCAVSDPTEDGKPVFVRLRDLQPHHWTQAYPADALEHYER